LEEKVKSRTIREVIVDEISPPQYVQDMKNLVLFIYNAVKDCPNLF
jgi:hypothetical protein